MSLLYPGDISATVRQLRRQLAEIGMPVTAVAEGASVYDEELKRHVIAFQTSRGIRPDGIVGPHTMIHLNTVVNLPDIPMLERAPKGWIDGNSVVDIVANRDSVSRF
jgi:general secretion pathway protein A